MYEIECYGLSLWSLLKLNLIGNLCFFVFFCIVAGLLFYYEHYAVEHLRFYIQNVTMLARTLAFSLIFLFLLSLVNAVFMSVGLFVYRHIKKIKITIL